MEKAHNSTTAVVNLAMPEDPVANIRLSPDIIEEADGLIPILQQDTRLRAGGRISRSTVLRLAVLEGMAVLRKTYPKKGKGKK